MVRGEDCVSCPGQWRRAVMWVELHPQERPVLQDPPGLESGAVGPGALAAQLGDLGELGWVSISSSLQGEE